MTTMQVAAPRRRESQRLDALRKANAVRVERSSFKGAVRAQPALVREAIAEPPEYLRNMPIKVLLRAVPGLGPARVRMLMRRVQISDAKTVGGLSERQRVDLLARDELTP